jgi:hypothetical protein
MLEDLEEQKENSILAKKELKPLKDKQPIQRKPKEQITTKEKIKEYETPDNSACGRGVRGVYDPSKETRDLEDSQTEEEEAPPTPVGGTKSPPSPTTSGIVKRPKGRPRKPIDREAEEFKKRVAEETEKAYKEVIESKIKSNIKKEMRKKAIEEEERFKDPEPKEDKPKRILSEKQLESLNKGREIAISRTKNKRDINKKIDEEVKTIKEAKKNIRKTLLVDKIREQIDGFDSDEDEEEIVIQKKPKAKKIPKQEEYKEPPPPPKQAPKITFY